jgi:beta-RFAP synthase
MTNNKGQYPARCAKVRISAPARLHMGFVDLNGELGRCYGSVGLALSAPHTRVVARAGEGLSVRGPSSERAKVLVQSVLQCFALKEGVALEIEEAIPEHVGLGSGTQLALAVGSAVLRLYGLDAEPREVARVCGRGVRSGIGIGAFEQGGFLVDGGRLKDGDLAPIISRVPFPPHWRILLIFDQHFTGLHGERETAAFNALPQFPAEQAALLCRLLLMQVLPALVEEDLNAFGEGISTLQRVVGEHFALAQGGCFCSPAVAEVLAWLKQQGVHGVGQSSWGPTGFAVLGSEAEGFALIRAARRRFKGDGPLVFHLCEARNRGGEIEIAGKVERIVASGKSGRKLTRI